MKSIISIFLCISIVTMVTAQDKDNKEQDSDRQLVEISCGTCNFDMKGGGCTLAVMIDGEPYFVEGSDLHDHGDAHGKHGMCSAVRKAWVEGEIIDGRFHATSIELLPVGEEKK